MSPLVAPDIIQVRGPVVSFYALRARDGIHLVDAGFLGGVTLLRRALRAHDWNREPIRGILVTHGHLDHIANLHRLAEETGAWIAAPELDEDHYAGTFSYRGASRVCGILETIARPITRYRPFRNSRPFGERMDFPVWCGLSAIHLPGHTIGHSGFFCADRKLLFCGDLFGSEHGTGFVPPFVFNSHPEQIPASIAKACALDADDVLPNHCDRSTPAVHRQRLHSLHHRLQR